MKSMGKRCFSLLLAMALVISGVTYLPDRSRTVCAADNIPEGYTPIYTVSELYGIRNNLSGNYILMNDIDLTEATSKGGSLDTGHGWTPINDFKGTFDGGGHRIKGMNIYGNAGQYCGLFGDLYDSARVKRLGLTDVNIDVSYNGSSYCGAIAGNRGRIEQCFVTGRITTEGYTFVGGICGYCYPTISDCYSNVEIKADGNAGGIAGLFTGGSIEKCYNRGSINNGTGAAIAYTYSSSDEDCVYLIGTGTDLGSATPLTETQMKDANYYINFDFDNIWEIDSDSLYPYPQLRNCMQINLTSLKWEKEPVKKEYNQGDKLDLSGGVLNYTYEDGSKSSGPITEYMVSGCDMMQIGEQTITIKKGNLAVTYKINIKPIPVTGVSLNRTELYMERGATETLAADIVPANATDQIVEWSSSNSSVATVDQTGKVRALANGETDIIATASNGQQAVCHVKVTVLCSSVRIDRYSLLDYLDYDTYIYAFPLGSSVQLSYTMYPEGTNESVEWIIDDSSVVSIDAQNRMWCLKGGYTTVKIRTESGQEDYIEVMVGENNVSEGGITDNNNYNNSNNANKVNNTACSHEYSTQYSAATYVSKGYTTYTCKKCGYSYKGNYTKKLKLGQVAKVYGTTKNGKVNLGWYSVTNATGYQIRYSTNKKMKRSVKTVKVKGKTKKVIKKLKRRHKYYIQVRAYKKVGTKTVYGKWSKKVHGVVR